MSDTRGNHFIPFVDVDRIYPFSAGRAKGAELCLLDYPLTGSKEDVRVLFKILNAQHGGNLLIGSDVFEEVDQRFSFERRQFPLGSATL